MPTEIHWLSQVMAFTTSMRKSKVDLNPKMRKKESTFVE